MSNPKNVLQEICFLRLVLIVLLVLYHSFAPFNTSWDPLPGQDSIAPVYKWVAMGAYAFMLETFTFISGYVFGYQVRRKGPETLGFKSVVLKKLKRLIIPSIIFSIIYLLIFDPSLFYFPIEAGYSVINGAGHMWYLPMLFWCFLGIWLLELVKLKPKVSLLLLLGLALVSYIPLPLRIVSAMYYMFFFFCGYCLKRYEWKISRWLTPKAIIIITLLFLLSFIGISVLKLSYGPVISADELPVLRKGMYYSILKLSQIVYSALGLFSVFLLATYLVEKKGLRLNVRLINLSSYCFGIYLFQQFVLKYIYYHTEIIDSVDITILPWVSFVAALLISLLFSWAMLKTKVGRYLIG